MTNLYRLQMITGFTTNHSLEELLETTLLEYGIEPEADYDPTNKYAIYATAIEVLTVIQAQKDTLVHSISFGTEGEKIFYQSTDSKIKLLKSQIPASFSLAFKKERK